VRTTSFFDLESLTETTLILKQSKQGLVGSSMGLAICLAFTLIAVSGTEEVSAWALTIIGVLAIFCGIGLFRKEEFIVDRGAGLIIYEKKLISPKTVTVPIGPVDVGLPDDRLERTRIFLRASNCFGQAHPDHTNNAASTHDSLLGQAEDLFGGNAGKDDNVFWTLCKASWCPGSHSDLRPRAVIVTVLILGEIRTREGAHRARTSQSLL
jgi:hypothetical protein